MTTEQLAHAIRAACPIIGATQVIVVGSQAIHGAFPDPSPYLQQSMEVDMLPANDKSNIEQLNSIGENSPFHKAHGFYVDPVAPSELKLPLGWQDRLIPFYPQDANGFTGLCLHPTDLAAAKLAAFREKDRDYVRVLVTEGYVRADDLVERIGDLPLDEAGKVRRQAWVQLTARTPTDR